MKYEVGIQIIIKPSGNAINNKKNTGNDKTPQVVFINQI